MVSLYTFIKNCIPTWMKTTSKNQIVLKLWNNSAITVRLNLLYDLSGQNEVSAIWWLGHYNTSSFWDGQESRPARIEPNLPQRLIKHVNDNHAKMNKWCILTLTLQKNFTWTIDANSWLHWLWEQDVDSVCNFWGN